MDEKMVKRYYELNEQLKQLQEERDSLNQKIKSQLLENGITKATVGHYLLEIKTQDRSKYDNSIVEYFKEIGMTDLIIETYNEPSLKEREKQGKFDENRLNQYKIEKLIPVLYVKPFQ